MSAEKTEKFTVLKPLAHDGRSYFPGMSIELKQSNADYLLRKRVIGRIEPQKPATTKEVKA